MKKWAIALVSGVALLGATNMSYAEENVVRLYTWTEYVPDGLLDDFTKETGIRVERSSLESNETMYAKVKLQLQGGDGGYDVIAPSNYFVSKMAKEGMLQELDHSKLPVIQDLNPDWLDKPYDKGNKYSLPQLLGAPGIAFNTDVYKGSQFKSWADLWQPEFTNIQLLDDVREVFNIALLKIGADPNTKDPAVIKQAYEELLKIRPHLVFNSDNPASSFISGEFDLGQLWNGSVRIAKKEQAPIDMVFPKEGPVLWVDTLAIPKNAKNADAAHKLINYLLSAEVAKKLTLAIGYPTSNIKALEMLPKEITEDPAIYPTAEVLQKSHWQDDVGDAIEIYEKYFQELKAAQ
ncbi:Spermidine/putrescine-binding periplasmic protein precursor [Phocoenobacter uteri]|uniref:Putrescine-binding periplasmic protein n=1 Tax=Phocoenobacter uteri TaxID=146806 RepID=A0A379CA26_9PAST|nr:extracellular solute-binding protein [Phocoenobacter uteri]MDG6881121.1 spermidine/putrescine ABC transporter substrate-binding protein [Phocoenobacter uteri]SUB59143.1 Spermidine/putrescine-binding periplasmic protein precursor [Phocoenobacter uteri]